LAERRFRVFGTTRKLRDKKPDDFEMLDLNVDSGESVQRCVRAVLKKTGRLDVLINNAGYALLGGIEETPIQEAKAEFETNFFGALRMVNAVLPTMRRQHDGQIINVSSIAAVLPIPFEGHYAAAKAALDSYTLSLRLEVKKFNIKVSAVLPGFFKTKIGDNAKFCRPLAEYAKTRKRVLGVIFEHVRRAGDSKEVAETILRMIQSRSPHLFYVVGAEGWDRMVRRLLPGAELEAEERTHWKLDR
jgi:NAD(P)-dependent dehydrogenase (short-subunit alcohol dehydrogenase family)